MSPQTFIFIGRSGCGKGTQVALLQKILKEKDPSHEIIHLETGSKFREFITQEGYSNKLSLEIYNKGERQPDFLAVRFWANLLVDTIKADKHIIFDGICRSLPEARIFSTISEFYDRKITVVNIGVSRDWSRKRLLARRRDDDNSYEIEKRLDWFEKDTYPAIEYFKKNDRCIFVDINGEQPIEDVHREIILKLGW
jgi:adenylate kinase family enzyme